jgi:hypothetical protein
MLSDDIINPFEIDPRDELVHPAEPLENWTEYVYYFGYCLETGHGVSIHIGREPTDPDVWRGTLGIFLDDGDLIVAKYHGRDGSDRGPGAGPLRVRCIEPFRTWVAEFDGLAHRVSRNSIMTETFTDDLAEMVKLNIVFTAVAPMWDLEKGAQLPSLVLVDGVEAVKNDPKRIHHFEQLGALKGEITYGGKTVQMAGGGVRDHSWGPRDYWPLVGSRWINAVFPSGKAIMLMLTRVTGFSFDIGYVYRGDGAPLEVVKVVEHPFVSDLDTPDRSVHADPLAEGAERNFRFVFEGKKGRETIEGEILHAMGTSYVSPNHELLGTDLSRIEGGSQLAECPARFSWDGETGVGVHERIVRMRALKA